MNRENFRKLLNPRSLAIVGPNDKNNAGAQALANALASGFEGPIYPINPNYQTLQGRQCHPSLTALPEVPDTVIVAVPTLGAMKILHEAASIGAPSIVFFNGGFTDAGNDAGRQRQLELLDVAERAGMAVAGPNCMGLLSRKRRFDSSFIPQPTPRYIDGISVVSQSGGLVNAFIELATNRGIGFNYIISSGNEAVVSTADYLDWLTNDADTKAIISIVEGVKDNVRFRAALDRATRRKPVVIVKLGRSEAGRSAVMAHTGSLAGSDATFSALCTQCGAALVDTVDAALETAAMFIKVPLPRGDRIVIFSGSGGATTLATDLASDMGLKFQPLSPVTNARLQQIFEVERPFINPFDVGAYPLLAKNNNMKQCLDTLAADDTVDLIGCVLVVQRDLMPIHRNVFDQMKDAVPTAGKPVVLISEMTSHWRDVPPDLGVYVTGSLNDGLIAMRHLSDYAAYRRRLTVDRGVARVGNVALPRPAAARSVLTEFESKQVLADAGLPISRETLVQTADQAVTAAKGIGFPVALKVQSPDLIHKSDVGGLMLGLRTEAELRQAFERLRSTVTASGSPRIDGWLVQEMVTDGVELLLGMHRDPTLGPTVVLSPGGVFVDLFEQSSAIRLPPFGIDQAESMIQESAPTRRLLAGFRGQPPADHTALIELICNFAGFVAGLSEDVIAIDLNPVMVLPGSGGVKIVDATIEFSSDTSHGARTTKN